MNEDKAQRLIVVLTFVTIGSTISYVLKPPKGVTKTNIKTHRVIAGGFFAMAISSVLADLDTTLGVGLATLVAGGAFLKYGLPVLTDVFGEPKLEERFPKPGIKTELKPEPVIARRYGLEGTLK